jgi:hypothetical protein
LLETSDSSQVASDALEQAKSKYDLIVVDTPPLTAVSDAFPLLGDVYVAYEMVASNPQDVGVTVLASVQRAFLENDRALQGKRRLTAATFGLLLLSALLIRVPPVEQGRRCDHRRPRGA